LSTFLRGAGRALDIVHCIAERIGTPSRVPHRRRHDIQPLLVATRDARRWLDFPRRSIMTFPLEGGCDCRAVRYRIESAPLVVHCCHCRWCQRESGASFALNAMIEADRVTSLAGVPELVATPSESGLGQRIARCPGCRIALWSNYAGAGPVLAFVRVGTLDDPDRLPPDIHIFTASKQPWVVLPTGARAVPEYYDRDALWSTESLARRRALLPRIEAWQATQRGAAG
jgi:hypothetical protein